VNVAKNTGRAFVRFGLPDQRGRRATTAYRVPLELDGQRYDVMSDVDTDPLAQEYETVWQTTIDAAGHLCISGSETVAPDAPSTWFVAVDAARHFGDGRRAIVVFSSDHFASGTVIDEMEFVMLPVKNEDQIGTVIWSKSTGLITEIYVAPEHRRTDVGILALLGAAAYHHSFGWNGLLHNDGKRTLLGQQFALGIDFAHRIAPHAELSPPMDPEPTVD